MAKGSNKIATTCIRIPPDLKEQLREIAETEHWTFNQTVVEAIKSLIEKQAAV